MYTDGSNQGDTFSAIFEFLENMTLLEGGNCGNSRHYDTSRTLFSNYRNTSNKNIHCIFASTGFFYSVFKEICSLLYSVIREAIKLKSE